jgi:hypothetical protein
VIGPAENGGGIGRVDLLGRRRPRRHDRRHARERQDPHGRHLDVQDRRQEPLRIDRLHDRRGRASRSRTSTCSSTTRPTPASSGRSGERLDLDPAKVADYIGQLGNTSAASVPLTLSLSREDGRLRRE